MMMNFRPLAPFDPVGTAGQSGPRSSASDALLDVQGSGRVRIVGRGDPAQNGWMEAIDVEGGVPIRHDLGAVFDTLPCFTPTASVATERGSVPVGELTTADRIVTRDNGPQSLRWIGRQSFGWQTLALFPMLQPVTIRAGALGPENPARDLCVSGNHLMLVARTAGGDEMLVPARDLLCRPGITQGGSRSIEYVQLLFERHELILADNCWSESFRPVPETLTGFTDVARHEIASAIPAASGSGRQFTLARNRVRAAEVALSLH